MAAMALAAPLTATAQSLPDEVRAAGITQVAWATVQMRWREAATEKQVSAKALGAICAKMGVRLIKDGRLDLPRLIGLIDSRADELKAINRRLAELAKTNDAETAVLLKAANAAINAGDLDKADTILEKARKSARAARENSQRREAEVIASEAQIKVLRLDYLGAAADYAEAAGALPASDPHGRWGYIREQARTLYSRGGDFYEAQPLRDAVKLYREKALPLVPRETAPDDWATTQAALGDVLSQLGKRGDDQAGKDGLAAYRTALEVPKGDRDPDHWADDMGKLASALTGRVAGEGDAQALKEAVAILRSALEVRSRERNPRGWAITQDKLGVALYWVGQQFNDNQALTDANAAYHLELEVFTRERYPQSWAIAQGNIGDVLMEQGRRFHNPQAYQDAVVAYRAQLQVYTRERNPRGWAHGQAYLAAAYLSVGQKWHSDEAVNGAIAAYRAALEITTRDRTPTDWALVTVGLGSALTVLGDHGDSQALKAALVCFRAAQEVLTRERYPQYWGVLQSDQGKALRLLGQRGDEQALKDAVTSYRAALEVITRDRNRTTWGITNGDLGMALELLGEHGDDQALRGSIVVLRDTLEIYPTKWYAETLARAEAVAAKRQH